MATYYVSNAGNDSNSGLSESAPWLTVAKANTAATADGDVILLRRGDTFLSSTLWVPAASNQRMGAYGTGAAPILDANSAATSCVTISSARSGIILEDVKCQNGIAGFFIASSIASSNNIIRRVVFDTFTDSIVRYSTGCTGTGHLCEDCTFLNSNNDGYSIFGNGDHTIRRCYFQNLGDDVIGGGQGDAITTHETGTAQVSDCFMYDCTVGGVTLTNTAGTSTVERCFMRRPGQYAYSQGLGGTLRIANCIAIVENISGNQIQAIRATEASVVDIYNCTFWGDTDTASYFIDAMNTSVVTAYNCAMHAAATNQRYLRQRVGATLTSDFHRLSVDGNKFNFDDVTQVNFAAWKTASGEDANTTIGALGVPNTTNPTLPADLRPLSGSALISAGNQPMPAWTGEKDYLNRVRPSADGDKDIGAYQFKSGLPPFGSWW